MIHLFNRSYRSYIVPIQNPTKNLPFLYELAGSLSYSRAMRRAFVLQMADQGPSRFEGRIEHIDSGRARRFRTLDEFLGFIEKILADCSDSDCVDQNQLFSQPDDAITPVQPPDIYNKRGIYGSSR